MAASFTGTPVPITWAAGSNPAGQTITIPAGTTAVYVSWTFWASGSFGLLSATLAGAAPDATFERPVESSATGTGVVAWANPPTGDQTLDVAWDTSPSEGPTCFVWFVKDGDTTTLWRDADADANQSTAQVSVTLTTVAGDLVCKHNQNFLSAPTGETPTLSAGWTDGATMENNSEGARASSISATGTSTVAAGEGEYYATVLAWAIPPAGAGGSFQPAWARNANVIIQ